MINLFIYFIYIYLFIFYLFIYAVIRSNLFIEAGTGWNSFFGSD